MIEKEKLAEGIAMTDKRHWTFASSGVDPWRVMEEVGEHGCELIGSWGMIVDFMRSISDNVILARVYTLPNYPEDCGQMMGIKLLKNPYFGLPANVLWAVREDKVVAQFLDTTRQA